MKWRLKGEFWMARLAFIAVCAFVVASTVNLWVGYKIEKSLKKADTQPQIPRSMPNVPKQRNFSALNDRNMFGAKREKISLLEVEAGMGESGRWEDAIPTTLGARLVATAVFPFPQYSLASIEVGGNIQSYSINECSHTQSQIDSLFVEILGPSVTEPLAPCNRLMGSAVIKRIEERRVIFYSERDRRYEYLAMDEGFVPVAPSRQMFAPSVASSDNLGSTLRKTGPNSYEIDAKDFDATMGNLSLIASQARIVPAFEDGKSIGFKLFNIAPNSIYSKIGMQDGDIITKINGYELNSPDKALELYQMRSTAQQLNIDYKRGGSSVTSDISIRR
ncbi:MAG: type II secretion system protein GspC [Myxococcaceae bacterium]